MYVNVCSEEGKKYKEYKIRINNANPILKQIKNHIRNKGISIKGLIITCNGGKILETDTVTSLDLVNGDNLDAFYPVSKNKADKNLVSHIISEGLNPNSCTYLSSNIAVWGV